MAKVMTSMMQCTYHEGMFGEVGGNGDFPFGARLATLAKAGELDVEECVVSTHFNLKRNYEELIYGHPFPINFNV